MTEKEPRLSHQALRVLRVFLDRPRAKLAGSDIWSETKLLSGTLYPLLLRLEKAGWLESEWEQIDPSEASRPRKRLYHLTPNGYNKALQAMAELGVTKGILAWKS
jgi:PadR family transcriptional regulator, regulatory protein PadR